MFGELEPSDVLEIVKSAFEFTAEFEGEIPGAKEENAETIFTTTFPWLGIVRKNILPTLKNTSPLNIKRALLRFFRGRAFLLFVYNFALARLKHKIEEGMNINVFILVFRVVFALHRR